METETKQGHRVFIFIMEFHSEIHIWT
jgi:hypothetical protein